MAIKIIVPNKQYSEIYFGLEFINGEAICEDEAKAKYISELLGYKLEPIVEEVTEDKVEGTVEEVKADKEPVKPVKTRTKKASTKVAPKD